MAFKLRSPPFPPSGEITIKHTCDGADLSPALRWSAPPGSPKSFALIMDDRDAPDGIWTHWVLHGIPATVRELPDGVPLQEMVAEVGTQGHHLLQRRSEEHT